MQINQRINIFRRCGKLTAPEQYITSQNGNPEMMLLKFDSAFASSASAGKGFSLTVSTRGTGKGQVYRKLVNSNRVLKLKTIHKYSLPL